MINQNNLFAIVSGKACKFPMKSIAVNKIENQMGLVPTMTSSRNGSNVKISVKLFQDSMTSTNQTSYDDFITFLKENKVKELLKMTDTYKVFVDYVVYDGTMKIIEEGIKIHDMDAYNIIRLLPVDVNNIPEHKFGKEMKGVVPFRYTPVHSLGILTTAEHPRYFRIKSISVMAEVDHPTTSDYKSKLNQTLIDTTISPWSPTISDIRNEMVEIFRSNAMTSSVIDLGTSYTTLTELEISVSVLDGLFIPYTEEGIDLVLKENAGSEGEGGEVKPPTPPCPPCEEDKFFAAYERCNKNDADAGIVVSDKDFDEGHYTGKAFKYSDVVKNIPDIQIGEYVEYIESLVIMNI